MRLHAVCQGCGTYSTVALVPAEGQGCGPFMSKVLEKVVSFQLIAFMSHKDRCLAADWGKGTI